MIRMSLYDSNGNLLGPSDTVYFGDTIYIYPYFTEQDAGAVAVYTEIRYSGNVLVRLMFSELTQQQKPGGGVWYEWTIPNSYMQTLAPNSTRSPALGWVLGYQKGGTSGEAGTLATIYLTVPSSVKPTLNLAVSEGNTSMPAALKDIVFVQNQSRIKAVSGAAGAYGSSIRSCIITIGSVTYASALQVTSDIITSAGSITVSVTATDSRGRTATQSTTVTVLAYSHPSLTSAAIYRCAGLNDTTPDRSGGFACISPRGAVTALGNHNAKTCTVHYKKTTDATYSTIAVAMADYVLDTEYVIFQVDTNATYNVYVTLSDSIAETTFICVQLPSAGAYIDIPENGQGMGVGKKLEGTGLEIGWDTHISGALSFNGDLGGGAESDADDNVPFVWANSPNVNFCPFFRVQVADGYMYFGVSPANSEFEMVHKSSGGTITVKRLSMT